MGRDSQVRMNESSPSTCLDYDESLGWKVQEGDRRGQDTTILRVCNEDQSPFAWPGSMKEAVVGMRDQGRAVHYIESSKQSLEELKQAHPGAEIVLGKPRQHADFNRPVWIYKAAKEGETDGQPGSSIVKCISSHWNTPERIAVDLKFARQLISALEPSAKQELEAEEESDKKRALDKLIIHLRQGHSVCYYCAIQCDCHEELLQVCGPVHLREAPSGDSSRGEVIDMEWFDRKIMRLIDAFSLHLPPLSLDQYLEGYHVSALDPTKFGCRHCNKLFKGADYVVKHLQLKHAEMVEGECTASLALLNNLLAHPGDCVLPATILPHHTHTSYNIGKRRRSLDQVGGGGISKRLDVPLHPHDKSSDIKRPLRKYIDLDAPVAANEVVDINYEEEREKCNDP